MSQAHRSAPGSGGQGSGVEVQTRALYSHTGGPGSQLSFIAGDLLTLMGGPADGWQFGRNFRTGQYGWFPLSFTEIPEGRRHSLHHTHTPVRYRQRARSFSEVNGDARSLSDLGGWLPDHYTVPGTQARPRSLHEASLLPSLPQVHVESSEHTAQDRHASSLHDLRAVTPQDGHAACPQQGTGDLHHAAQPAPPPPPPPPPPPATG
ncbi:uncharacterized protein LOC143294328 [Babylonia areolata]|uniref:uncharacterized protein LOC143294328 n=1 Tax=Babylonia areolata TaxID=304850 RepID=UPI003FCEFD34